MLMRARRMTERPSHAEEEEVLTWIFFHIEDLLHEGQEVLVQVSKEPLGTKGARITSHVSTRRHLVLMPMVTISGFPGGSRMKPNANGSGRSSR
jgi:Ribonuclease G/E